MGADLRRGIALGFGVSLSGIVGIVSIVGARWGLVVVMTGMITTILARAVQPRRAVSRRVVLVGTQQLVDAYTDSLAGSEVTVVGNHVVDAGPALAVASSNSVPSAGSLDTIPDLVSDVRADMVLILPSSGMDSDSIRRLTWGLDRSAARVGVLTPVSAVSDHRLSTMRLGDSAVLEVGPVGGTLVQAAVKSVVDRLVAASLLVLVSPLLLVLVLTVRLDSRGPGFFVQTRVGKDGKLFRMLKLRTMYADAEAMKKALLADNEFDGVLFKIRRDPRVTRIGYWLRRSSLDELPQLINVLLGQMSMVGPRPALPSEVAAYDRHARRRLDVKPGITGLWQVSGRSDLSWEESIRLDLHYADNWRLADDLSIGARTVSAVIRARGAY